MMKKSYSDKQGQYLAFIYYYGKIHGCAPSEAEMQQYFRVSPPSVHQMILTLETHGLIERTPGQKPLQFLSPRWPKGGQVAGECIRVEDVPHLCLNAGAQRRTPGAGLPPQ